MNTNHIWLIVIADKFLNMQKEYFVLVCFLFILCINFSKPTNFSILLYKYWQLKWTNNSNGSFENWQQQRPMLTLDHTSCTVMSSSHWRGRREAWTGCTRSHEQIRWEWRREGCGCIARTTEWTQVGLQPSHTGARSHVEAVKRKHQGNYAIAHNFLQRW